MNSFYRCMMIGMVGVLVMLGGCSQQEEQTQQQEVPEKESFILRGEVYCGPVQACTGRRFLIYTEYGGKIIHVIPTKDRTRDDIAKLLRNGVPVEIEGIEERRVKLHLHEVPADRIHFLEPSEDSGEEP